MNKGLQMINMVQNRTKRNYKQFMQEKNHKLYQVELLFQNKP